MNTTIKVLSLIAAASLFAACGGGGGSPSTNSPLTGIFIDSPVEGLGYSTATQSGKTGADGSFKYLSGENLTFSLYGQNLFSPKGFSYLTPFDLSDTSVNPNYSINLIRFLLALDEDSNPNNGIKLPPFVGTLDIDFNKSIREFEADTDGRVARFLNANANGRGLASVQAAVDHFNSSLQNINPNYTLAFAGRTATSIVKNTSCTNNVTAGSRYTFGATSVRLVGSDGFFNNGDGNCVVLAESDETYAYSEFLPGELLSCAPNCTYKQLNRISFISTDVDGRTAVEWSWHTPYSSVITSVKTILADPRNNNHPASLNTFVEVITLQ